MIETKNIQSATIPEESSRANSEVDIQRKLSSESKQIKASLMERHECSVSEIDKSSSQSSLPIINVTDNEGVTTTTTDDLISDNNATSNKNDNKQKQSDIIESSSTHEIAQTHVEPEITVDKAVQSEPAPIIETSHHSSSHIRQVIVVPSSSEQKISESPPKHVQIIEIEIETHAEPSAPDEQLISKENMPNVIRKLSIQEEADKLQEAITSIAEEEGDEDLEELTSDSFVPGYVAPGELYTQISNITSK